MSEHSDSEDSIYWFVLRGQSLGDWFILDSDHICDRKVSNWKPGKKLPSQERLLPLKLEDSSLIQYFTVKVLAIFDYEEEAMEFKNNTLKEEKEAAKEMMGSRTTESNDGSLMDITLECEHLCCKSVVAQLLTEFHKSTIVQRSEHSVKLQDEVDFYKKKTEHLEKKITELESFNNQKTQNDIKNKILILGPQGEAVSDL